MSADDKNRAFAQKVISNCFKDIESENVKLDLPDTKGDGYLSSLMFAEVNYKSKVYHLVIKVAPQNEERRNFTNAKNIFLREAYFYTTIYPAMREHQKEKLVDHGFSSITRCYGTCLKDKSETLILQDLKKLDYTLWDRKIPMDQYHVTKVLEEYGKLHAASFALRNQNPERFQNITDCYRESDILVDIVHLSKALDIYDSRFKQTAEMLSCKGYEREAQKIENFRKKIPDILLKSGDRNDIYSVVLHGDCWCNNMMFSYGKVSILILSRDNCICNILLSRGIPSPQKCAF